MSLTTLLETACWALSEMLIGTLWV